MGIDMDGAVTESLLRRQTTRQQLVEQEVDTGSFRDIAVDLVAGFVSGCAGIVVGQVRTYLERQALACLQWQRYERER